MRWLLAVLFAVWGGPIGAVLAACLASIISRRLRRWLLRVVI